MKMGYNSVAIHGDMERGVGVVSILKYGGIIEIVDRICQAKWFFATAVSKKNKEP